MFYIKNKILVLSFGLLLLSSSSFAFNIGDFEIGDDSNSSDAENSKTNELDLDGLASGFGSLFDAPNNDNSLDAENSKTNDLDLEGLASGFGSLFNSPKSDGSDGFSLDGLTSGLEGGISDLSSGLEKGLGDLSSGIGGGLRDASQALGGGEILGLSQPVVRDFTLATKLFREALDIENSAEYEEAMANCMGEKVCTNDELDKISNASAEVLAEIERRKASGEGLSAEAKAKFNEGLVPFARATASGGVLIAVMINAGSQINNCDSNIFAAISCVANAAVVIDILGGLQPMVSGFMDSAGTIYDFSKSNGLEVPEEEGAS
jgi:hypothetical protein